MVNFLIFLHIMVGIILILIILLQVGKVSDLGGAFGISSSQTLFGPRRANILTRITAISAGIFMLTSLLLTILIPKHIQSLHRKLPLSPQKQKPPITAPAPIEKAPIEKIEKNKTIEKKQTPTTTHE